MLQKAKEIREDGASIKPRLVFPSAPLKMSETLYDGFEKMGKKQNKEQVPPPPEPQNKKSSSSKPSKKSLPSNIAAPATHKTLEEAFKAVSNQSLS